MSHLVSQGQPLRVAWSGPVATLPLELQSVSQWTSLYSNALHHNCFGDAPIAHPYTASISAAKKSAAASFYEQLHTVLLRGSQTSLTSTGSARSDVSHTTEEVKAENASETLLKLLIALFVHEEKQDSIDGRLVFKLRDDRLSGNVSFSGRSAAVINNGYINLRRQRHTRKFYDVGGLIVAFLEAKRLEHRMTEERLFAQLTGESLWTAQENFTGNRNRGDQEVFGLGIHHRHAHITHAFYPAQYLENVLNNQPLGAQQVELRKSIGFDLAIPRERLEYDAKTDVTTGASKLTAFGLLPRRSSEKRFPLDAVDGCKDFNCVQGEAVDDVDEGVMEFVKGRVQGLRAGLRGLWGCGSVGRYHSAPPSKPDDTSCDVTRMLFDTPSSCSYHGVLNEVPQQAVNLDILKQYHIAAIKPQIDLKFDKSANLPYTRGGRVCWPSFWSTVREDTPMPSIPMRKCGENRGWRLCEGDLTFAKTATIGTFADEATFRSVRGGLPEYDEFPRISATMFPATKLFPIRARFVAA
ncbi:uncharacterized protein EV422DRAFT_508316 [Fimicolochytrium jonesii]|uniref:uncharacterized protein n=1 Tax=Fimicolochytrium jonesii TaxID=1396493 RepID=UPI0022FDD285|nr:uncharacterized protein EV422DRAFT_508316 [Fimicolochytrium jonesii]KAI8818092.1 hypothetical protein EV422DRAFT_508316 [Fimicolochytrium jonesii]